MFGDQAIVHGLSTEKSSMAGKDTSGQDRYTDVFAKRDGRWQCVTGTRSRCSSSVLSLGSSGWEAVDEGAVPSSLRYGLPTSQYVP